MLTIPVQDDPGLVDACGEVDRSYTCEKVYEWTDNEFLATASEWLLDRPIRILLILAIAWVLSRLARRGIQRFATRIAESPTDPRLEALRQRGPGRLLVDEDASMRAQSRAETIGLVLRSVVGAAVWTIAGLLVLGQLEIDLAPLIGPARERVGADAQQLRSFSHTKLVHA